MTGRSIAEGYRRKPKWIYAVGTIFAFTPLGNLIFTLASLRVPQWYMPATWLHWLHYISATTWVLMSFICLSGLSLLLFVRRWALFLTLFTLAVVITHNVVFIRSFSLMGTMALTMMIVTTAVTGYFLYFTRFRKPYTNPKMRWWETSPRFRVDILAKIDDVSPHPTLTDISITGALLAWAENAPRPAPESVTHIVLPPGLRIPCAVARTTDHGYGVKFLLKDRAILSQFKSWIKQLERDPTQISW